MSADEDYFMRIPEVLRTCGISRSEVYRRMAAGSFPKCHKLSPRVSVWRASDVRRWRLSYIQVEDLIG